VKVYLAARYSRKSELLAHRDELDRMGVTVTSRWLDGDYPTGGDGRSLVAPDEVRAKVASEDMADVLAADTFVAFTEPARSGGRGGRHVEFGIALAAGKHCIVIGEAENVFYMLPGVRRFADWGAFLDWLLGEGRRR
jgi:nucleoside 2-deoxyribosyltransferase